MKFFADTSDLDAIQDLADCGMLDGVTTNPSIIAKSGKEFIPLIKEITEICSGPVSAEVASTDYDTMIKEAEKLAEKRNNERKRKGTRKRTRKRKQGTNKEKNKQTNERASLINRPHV